MCVRILEVNLTCALGTIYLILEIGSLWNLVGLEISLGWLASEPEIGLSPPPRTEITNFCYYVTGFLCGCWVLNSGPHIYIANTLHLSGLPSFQIYILQQTEAYFQTVEGSI